VKTPSPFGKFAQIIQGNPENLLQAHIFELLPIAYFKNAFPEAAEIYYLIKFPVQTIKKTA
jgi:hypothetical protein